MSNFHESQFFKESTGLGADPERCANCGHNVMDHYNSRCPKDEDEKEGTQEKR